MERTTDDITIYRARKARSFGDMIAKMDIGDDAAFDFVCRVAACESNDLHLPDQTFETVRATVRACLAVEDKKAVDGLRSLMRTVSAMHRRLQWGDSFVG